MKSTTYAIIFIESLDAVWIFKLLNFMKILKGLFRFINSFSDASPPLNISHCMNTVRSDPPGSLFRFIFIMFIFENRTVARLKKASILTD